MADDTPKRPRGRPRLAPGDESISVQFRLPTKQYDELYREASRQRVSLADMLRAAVTAKIKRP